MAMLTKDFWYDLPPDRIAQAPVRPRDHSKLMALDCATREIDHLHFYDLPSLLKPGDLLVWNDTKVFRARLTATAAGREFEVFLLRPQENQWLALAKPGRKLKAGDVLSFADDVQARLVDKLEDGSVLLHFDLTPDQVFAFTDKHGQVPTPPYVQQGQTLEDYQTVYAQKTGSAAAPTAGFHFTPELIDKLKAQGVTFATVTLHVGLGTFRPVTTETLEGHVMHEEWIDIPAETSAMIAEAKRRGGRVIAVGTTTVRALESGVEKGFTDIFITPGYKFKIVDALITNFHLPESTLIVLVSAFAQNKMSEPDAGRHFVLDSYQKAIDDGYRFYSFGDAMFIR
jgi:S-adenosylmethionine:tRNA ribosyltransferase-isomerase